MKFEAVVFEVMRVVMVNCKSILAGLSTVTHVGKTEPK